MSGGQAVLESDEERETLERWSRWRNSSQALAMRSRIVLDCAEGLTNLVAAARCRVDSHTAAKWRCRFLERRLDGLMGEPRPGCPARITTDQVDVVVATLEPTPKNATTGRGEDGRTIRAIEVNDRADLEGV
jgi:hypothetical protein